MPKIHVELKGLLNISAFLTAHNQGNKCTLCNVLLCCLSVNVLQHLGGGILFHLGGLTPTPPQKKRNEQRKIWEGTWMKLKLFVVPEYACCSKNLGWPPTMLHSIWFWNFLNLDFWLNGNFPTEVTLKKWTSFPFLCLNYYT